MWLRGVVMHVPSTEVTQEVASRGMGVLYELSQGNGRDDLVKMLVETLMEGRK